MVDDLKGEGRSSCAKRGIINQVVEGRAGRGRRLARSELSPLVMGKDARTHRDDPAEGKVLIGKEVELECFQKYLAIAEDYLRLRT